MTTTAYTCLVYTAALGTLLALALASGTPLTGYGAENLATALAMAVFCTLLGHSVFSWALKYFPPSFVSTARLMDCVFSAVWGALLFSELPAMQALLGGIAVISGVVLYTKSETRGGKGENEPCGSSGTTCGNEKQLFSTKRNLSRKKLSIKVKSKKLSDEGSSDSFCFTAAWHSRTGRRSASRTCRSRRK